MSKLVFIVGASIVWLTVLFICLIWPRRKLSRSLRWFDKLTPQEKNCVILWMAENLHDGNFPEKIKDDWISVAHEFYPRPLKKGRYV
jgi:hypothetical protein